MKAWTALSPASRIILSVLLLLCVVLAGALLGLGRAGDSVANRRLVGITGLPGPAVGAGYLEPRFGTRSDTPSLVYPGLPAPRRLDSTHGS